MDPVVAIMIKNEETAICPTLQPFVDAGYVHFLIYDTGSEDKTVEVVRDFLTVNGKVFHIVEEAFVNFSVSRNKCLDYAVKLFPQCRFTLTLDCEWYITGAEKIPAICAAIENPDEAYQVYIQAGSFYPQKRLFANNGKARYHAPVHEYVLSQGNTSLPEDIFFTWRPNNKGREKTNKRWYKDLTLLLEDFTDTKDPRSCFYLGQTYDCLGDWENAIKYYKLRSDITEGFVEEQYMALLRIGMHYSERDWNKALEYYLKAYEFRPTRIESLVKIAMHYGKAELKYMYARQACAHPFPKGDGLFIDRELYDYHRWDQLAIGAWYMGAYQEGYEALLKARAIKPELAHIQRNYLMYRSKLFPNEVYKESVEKEIASKSSVIHPSRILNLILYSSEDEHNVKMYAISSKYLKLKGIDHFFYRYKEDLEDEYMIEDDIFYIRGKETYRPGVLEKTLFVLEYFSKYLGNTYDYIVRTNISTCLNFDILKSSLQKKPVDYGGPLYYTLSKLNPIGGMDEENLVKYGNYGFISGICIVLSSKATNYLISKKEEILSYGLMDDSAISVAIRSNKDHSLIDEEIKGTIEWNKDSFNPTALIYRNKTEGNREVDITNMETITNSLLNATPADFTELESMYYTVCSTPSDIHEHVPVLYNLANECNSVLEIGVQRLTPTWGFIRGLAPGGKYIGIGTEYPNIDVYTKANVLALSKNLGFFYINKNEFLIDPSEIGLVDMIFIDSIHTYCHVTYQLHKFSSLAAKYLVFHDTSDPWGNENDRDYHGNYSEYPPEYSRTKKGVWPAIDDFLRNSQDWKLKERKFNNHGLVILERMTVEKIREVAFTEPKKTSTKKKSKK